nr:DNA polymerase III subunit gamma/tau [uncultured Flavobacterium sp.]
MSTEAKAEITAPEAAKPTIPEIKPIISEQTAGTKVSALSLASIKAKRELEASQRATVRHHDELPKEPFTETDMLLQWTNFAQKLSDKGQKIMATYMLINDPTLEGTAIKLELPNEGSKVDFDNNKTELLGYLRGKLHNHDIVIDVHVNEVTQSKHAFTPLEKYEKLKSINPAMELLRKTFDLDV